MNYEQKYQNMCKHRKTEYIVSIANDIVIKSVKEVWGLRVGQGGGSNSR